MSGIAGGIVGAQEGIEAGLVTGGLASSEKNTLRAIGIGLGATAVGVAIGHKSGEHAIEWLEEIIGEAGVGFLPAIAIGSNVAWHNNRSKRPQDFVHTAAGKATLALGAGFAAFEGVESGILTSATGSNLLSAEAVTLAVATATTAVIIGIAKGLPERFTSPQKALETARAVALIPAVWLGVNAVPELAEDPKVGALVMAGLGVTAVGSAIKSFFKPSRQTEVIAD
jgi:putative Mn2+ efflux pump MntP